MQKQLESFASVQTTCQGHEFNITNSSAAAQNMMLAGFANRNGPRLGLVGPNIQANKFHTS